MTRSSRFLGTAAPPPPPEEILAAETDMVVILSALLCALICVAGLAAVARCAWLRRLTGVNSSAVGESPPPPANKGLKKKALQSLPKSTFSASAASAADSPCSSGGDGGSTTECAICLTEFSDGEEIRILPLCSHAFHVACIDKWLSSRSSCPSCRRSLVPVKCDKCGHRASTAETQVKDQPFPPPPPPHQHPSQFTSSIIPTFLP